MTGCFLLNIFSFTNNLFHFLDVAQMCVVTVYNTHLCNKGNRSHCTSILVRLEIDQSATA